MSKGILYEMPSGKFAAMLSMAFLTDSATSMAFAPGSIFMSSTAAFRPFIPLSVAYEDASSEILATSFRRIIEPSGYAFTTMSSNSLTEERRPCAVIGMVMSASLIGAWPSTPAADSRFWSFMADCRSCTVSPMSASLSGCTHICIA